MSADLASIVHDLTRQVGRLEAEVEALRAQNMNLRALLTTPTITPPPDPRLVTLRNLVATVASAYPELDR